MREELAKKAGITLINDDGTPGSFGYLWNTGNYYWQGNKITSIEANHITYFVDIKGYPPNNIEEANKFCKENFY